MIPMTPFMLLVLTGFATFIGVLGTVWLRQFIADRR
jgi:hypothetical protein